MRMQFALTADTTTLSYWLNWRVCLCAVWVLSSIVIASYLIWKYEVLDHYKDNKGETNLARISTDQAWRPCVNEIHPVWLLIFRFVAFCLLITALVVKVNANGFGMFYYYTQWTFTLVTFYFGFGTLLSTFGCYKYHKFSSAVNAPHDTEQGCYIPLPGAMVVMEKKIGVDDENNVFNAAGTLGYIFQIIYQMNAGAVMLTDSLYWIVIYPFLNIKDYNLNFMTVNMHTLNAILLIGDAALNSLPFPWFRISYFFLWTSIFVIFQWIIHACILIWWPYPFLDLSSPYAPLWYFLVAMMHIPCYGFFALIVEIKHYLLSTWFSQSYQR